MPRLLTDLAEIFQDAKRECQSWPLCRNCQWDTVEPRCAIRNIYELAHAMTHNVQRNLRRPGESLRRFKENPPGKDKLIVRAQMALSDCQKMRKELQQVKYPMAGYKKAISADTYLQSVINDVKSILEIAAYVLKDEAFTEEGKTIDLKTGKEIADV